MAYTARCVLALVATMLPGLGLACDTTTRLDGMLTIPQCDPATSKACIPAGEALYQATTAFDIPNVFTIALQTSPWRMYDADDRIVTVEEMAAVVRSKRSDADRRAYLAGSWTAAKPDGREDTLARRLSAALDGFPVDGSDGFLWLSAAGDLRTTHQAFSAWKTGPYAVERGADVLMPLVAGWTGISKTGSPKKATPRRWSVRAWATTFSCCARNVHAPRSSAPPRWATPSAPTTPA